MKEGIHPKYYKTTIRCACGNVIEVGSTRENISVEICSKCHPFYTGKQSWSIPAAVLTSSTRSTASSNYDERLCPPGAVRGADMLFAG